MALTVNGQSTTSYSAGSNLTLFCSAQSSPAAQLQWAFSGALVNITGPLLNLNNVTENHSGPYSCLAFNNLTNMSNSITTMITIASEFVHVGILYNLSIYFPVHSFIFTMSLQDPQGLSSRTSLCGSSPCCY